MSPRLVAAGYHDVQLRWDLSTPERVVARLGSLDHQGPWPQPGRTLWATRDRFGKWHHLLGETQLLGWVNDLPNLGLIRRLEAQTHLGDAGIDDLVPVPEWQFRWLGLEQQMAVYGVLPAGDPRLTRVDVAVDVEYDDPTDGFAVLEGLKNARWPNGWYSEWAGPPPYTTVNVKAQTKTIARVYCRNTKTRNGQPRWGRLRFEREQRFTWAQALGADTLDHPALAEMVWLGVFGAGRASGTVTRLAREVQTVKLIDRVRLGEMGYGQFERMTAFLDAERLGMADQVYSPETLRRRRREAKQLGLSMADTELEQPPQFDRALDDLLAVPRSAFAA